MATKWKELSGDGIDAMIFEGLGLDREVIFHLTRLAHVVISDHVDLAHPKTRLLCNYSESDSAATRLRSSLLAKSVR